MLLDNKGMDGTYGLCERAHTAKQQLRLDLVLKRQVEA